MKSNNKVLNNKKISNTLSNNGNAMINIDSSLWKTLIECKNIWISQIVHTVLGDSVWCTGHFEKFFSLH